MSAEFLEDIQAFANSIRRGASVNVNDAATTAAARELVRRYFSSVRPALVEVSGESGPLYDVDEAFQRLQRLAHGKNSRSSYTSTVREIRDNLRELVIESTTAAARGLPARPSLVAGESILILQTLEKLVPSAGASYRQGCLDLADSTRVSYRGTATEFREALREVLDHLAPDAAVSSQPGFKMEKDRTAPTTKQKIKFVLSERRRAKNQIEVTTRATDLVEELAGQLTRDVQNRVSLATHIQQARSEVIRIKRYIDTILQDILEIVSDGGNSGG